MARKYGIMVFIGFLGATLLASTLHGQDQDNGPGRRGPRMGGMFRGMGGRGPGPMGLLSLLRSEKIQKELEITEDQQSKLEEMGRESMDSMRENYESLQDLSEEERRSKWQKFISESQEKLQKKLGEVLQPKQFERLEQIELQLQGPMTFVTPKIAKALDITKEQTEKIESILEEMWGKIREAMAGIRDLSAEERREKFSEMREQMQKLNKEFGDKILEVLTSDQRDKFEKMKGEKFDIDPSELMPRFRGGPPPDGPGGPPPQ